MTTLPPHDKDRSDHAPSAQRDRSRARSASLRRLIVVLFVTASIAAWFSMQSAPESIEPALLPTKSLAPTTHPSSVVVANDPVLSAPLIDEPVAVALEKPPREALQVEPAMPEVVEQAQLDIVELAPDELPVLISGWVTDSAGLSLEDIWVIASIAPSQEAPALRPQLTDCFTDSEGRFEIRGNVLDRKLTLRAMSHDHSDATPVEVSAGRHDVVLVLGDVARLFGSILVDESIDPADLTLALVAPQLRTTWPPNSDGSFELSDVPIGRSMLVICAHSWIGPSLELIEIDAEPGDEIRLEPIDLRGRLMTTRLNIEGPGGQLARDVIVRADPDGPIQHIMYTMGMAVAYPMRIEEGSSTGPVPSRPDLAGRHLFFHAGPIEAEIDTAGLRAEMYTFQGGEDRVQLGEGLDIELRLIGIDRLPSTVRTGVTLDRAPTNRGFRSIFASSSYVHFRLRSPGTWTGRIHVADPGSNYADSERGQEIRVEVLDVIGVQRFDIYLDERTLAPARELARRNSER